jgi:hypothetical protein
MIGKTIGARLFGLARVRLNRRRRVCETCVEMPECKHKLHSER